MVIPANSNNKNVCGSAAELYSESSWQIDSSFRLPDIQSLHSRGGCNSDNSDRWDRSNSTTICESNKHSSSLNLIVPLHQMIIHANEQCALWVDVKLRPSSPSSKLLIINLWLFGTYCKRNRCSLAILRVTLIRVSQQFLPQVIH